MSHSTMRGQAFSQPAEIYHGVSRGGAAVRLFNTSFASASDPTRERSAQANSRYSPLDRWQNERHDDPYYANHGREMPGYSQRRWEAERPYNSTSAGSGYSYPTQRTTTYSTTYHDPRSGQIGGSRQVFGGR